PISYRPRSTTPGARYPGPNAATGAVTAGSLPDIDPVEHVERVGSPAVRVAIQIEELGEVGLGEILLSQDVLRHPCMVQRHVVPRLIGPRQPNVGTSRLVVTRVGHGVADLEHDA